MREDGLSLKDLMHTKTKVVNTKRSIVVKYRNDATGETWTCRGRPPRWLEDKDKNQYLIKSFDNID